MNIIHAFWRLPLHAYGIIYFYNQQYRLFIIQVICMYLGYQGTIPLLQFVSDISGETFMIRKLISVSAIEIIYLKMSQIKYLLLILKLMGEVQFHSVWIFAHFVIWSILEDPIYLHPLRFMIEEEETIQYVVSILRQSISIALIIYSGAFAFDFPDNYLPPMMLVYTMKILVHFALVLLSHYLFSLYSFEMLKQFYLFRVLINYNKPSDEKFNIQEFSIIYICILFTIFISQP